MNNKYNMNVVGFGTYLKEKDKCFVFNAENINL